MVSDSVLAQQIAPRNAGEGQKRAHCCRKLQSAALFWRTDHFLLWTLSSANKNSKNRKNVVAWGSYQSLYYCGGWLPLPHRQGHKFWCRYLRQNRAHDASWQLLSPDGYAYRIRKIVVRCRLESHLVFGLITPCERLRLSLLHRA